MQAQSILIYLLQNPALLLAVIVMIAGLIFIAFKYSGGNAKIIRQRAEKLGNKKYLKTEKKINETLRRDSGERPDTILGKLALMLPNVNKLRYMLEMSEMKLNIGQYLFICICTAITSTSLLAVFSSINPIATIFLGIAAGAYLPNKFVTMKVYSRGVAFVKLFPDAIELIVRGLRSGLPVQESFQVISEEIGEPVSKEFKLIAQNIKLGMPLERALEVAAKRLQLLEFDFFVTSLNLQRETGGNLAEILGNLSGTIRNRFIMKMKIRAMSSEARASAWIVGALPFLVTFALYVLNPEYLDPLFDDIRGNIALAIACGMLWFGIFVMKKMASFEI